MKQAWIIVFKSNSSLFKPIVCFLSNWTQLLKGTDAHTVVIGDGRSLSEGTKPWLKTAVGDPDKPMGCFQPSKPHQSHQNWGVIDYIIYILKRSYMVRWAVKDRSAVINLSRVRPIVKSFFDKLLLTIEKWKPIYYFTSLFFFFTKHLFTSCLVHARSA